jgi:hypothetical protein
MVPGTEGVTPSLELAAFDPISRYRQPVSPVSSSVPPLYAFLATPFSFLGWKGFFLVNIVAFLASTVAARRGRAVSGRRETPWIAAGLFLLGGYGVDAQGVWPHMLSATIAATGFFLACRARRDDSALKAALAGFLTGLAVGIRYQNIVFAFAVGLGLLLLSRARLRLAPAFALGVALPILACSFLNHERLGTWNPISKGKGYLTTGLTRPVSRILLEAPSVLYVKVLDFSAHPPLSDPVLEIQAFWRPDPRTGVLVFFGAIKKAWVQSSPWILLGLVALIFAWLWDGAPARDDLRAAGLAGPASWVRSRLPVSRGTTASASTSVISGARALLAVVGPSRPRKGCRRRRPWGPPPGPPLSRVPARSCSLSACCGCGPIRSCGNTRRWGCPSFWPAFSCSSGFCGATPGPMRRPRGAAELSSSRSPRAWPGRPRFTWGRTCPRRASLAAKSCGFSSTGAASSPRRVPWRSSRTGVRRRLSDLCSSNGIS